LAKSTKKIATRPIEPAPHMTSTWRMVGPVVNRALFAFGSGTDDIGAIFQPFRQAMAGRRAEVSRVATD
jgi:hypothetical protein